MDDALVVRGGQAARDLRRDLDGLTEWQRVASGSGGRPTVARAHRPQALAQRLAHEQLGDDEHLTGVDADVVDRQDVRV